VSESVGFSTNFQREAQGLCLLAAQGFINRKEVRENLPNIGLIVTPDKFNSRIEGDEVVIPVWAYELVEAAGIDSEILYYLPVYAFQSGESLTQALNEFMAQHVPTGPDDNDEKEPEDDE